MNTIAKFVIILSFAIIIFDVVITYFVRKADANEEVCNDYVFRNRFDIYYLGTGEKIERYTGSDTCCFYFDNKSKKIKYTSHVFKGIPIGEWKKFDSSGNLIKSLSFKYGKIQKN